MSYELPARPLSSCRPATPPPRGWYAFCAAFPAASPIVRLRISRQTLATYARIGRLPAAWGEELDRRAAPLLVLRWVAYGSTPSERQRRFSEALVTHEATAKWPRCSRGAKQIDA